MIPVAQSGLERAADLPNAPLLLDLARNDEEHRVLALLASDAAVGRGFMMPPGVPKDRVQAMRRAFDMAMADPGFRDDAKKRNLTVEPMDRREAAGRWSTRRFPHRRRSSPGPSRFWSGNEGASGFQ